jgi:hypothetical protein
MHLIKIYKCIKNNTVIIQKILFFFSFDSKYVSNAL